MVTLKSRLGITHGHLKWHHSIDCLLVPIRLQCDSILYRFRDKAIYWSKITIFHTRCTYLCEQEAQLSQRNRAMLRAIEYFAKSLKIIQGHSK